ncbi:MAG: rod shape-determining protein MreD [Clostridia bacterium]|nr:rod shape-determining protein MreD [Clostridia bacterium]MBQ7108049.1 rod shape-determining protein MreD [Clostridia bacterium]MBQ9919800.1 rod shape-determining protein MreD [Clostridia bacterium]
MINYVEKYHHHMYYSLVLWCFGVFILQRIEPFSLKIGTAFPELLLPAVIVIACFLREWTGFLAGLLCGIALDTVTNGTQCFNTITLMLFGVSIGLIFRFLLNRNIKAMIIVSILGCFLFFLLKWFFLDLLNGDSSATMLLFKYHIPSAIYTSLFAIPFFYYVRWLCKRHLIEQ